MGSTWQFLKKLKNCHMTQQDITNSTESLCPHETCIQMFVTALFIIASKVKLGFLGGSVGKDTKHGFDPWVGKIP